MTSDPPREGRAYRADLDGLRAIAILLVIAAHAGLGGAAGAAGVTAFFVLSGYLITGILLNGQALPEFYRRRVRRLAPAFLVMLAVVGTAGIAGVWGAAWQPDKFVSSVFYVTNWPLAFDSAIPGPTDHAWSLAIEEQFYLSWPLIVAFAPRRILAVAVAGIVVALLLRSLTSAQFGYYVTFARMDNILLGCVAAIIGLRLRPVFGWAGLALLAVAAVSSAPRAHATTLAEVAALLIVTSRLPLGFLAPIGKRAYSLYLWNWPMAMLGVWPLTFLAGEMSYRFVERPFLAASRSHGPAVGAGRS